MTHSFPDSGNRPCCQVAIRRMTTDEHGNTLAINYSFAASPFGELLIASTPKGICSLEFADNRTDAVDSLKRRYPQAIITAMQDDMHRLAYTAIFRPTQASTPVYLHIAGSDFQMKVWNTLLTVPHGHTAPYSGVAAAAGCPRAWRAVGSAVGANPVALLIPCHRVITASGKTGNYRWGAQRKAAILQWELTHPHTLL